MSGCGAFGNFEAYEEYGVKRYKINVSTDVGTLSHAWTERCVLDYITQLCDTQATCQLKFLGEHVAKFQEAYVDRPYDVVCLKMERVKGMELNDHLIRARKGIPEIRTIRMCCQMIQTLATLHECGIAHRDLKLDNIMVKADGSLVFIDWGTAHVGSDMREEQVACGTRRANSIQQLALEASKDGNLTAKMRSLLFKRKKPAYDMQANDCVQLAHMMSALWTSCTTGGDLICSAFGPTWDEASEELGASDLLRLLSDMYDGMNENPIYDLYPEPFREIIAQLILIDEGKRLTAMGAWRQLWAVEKMVGPRSGKTIDLRKYLDEPPTRECMKDIRARLQDIVAAREPAMNLSAQELLLRWEHTEPVQISDEHAPMALIETKADLCRKRKRSAIDVGWSMSSDSSISSCSTASSLHQVKPDISRKKRRCHA